jgi:hypothetical protein
MSSPTSPRGPSGVVLNRPPIIREKRYTKRYYPKTSWVWKFVDQETDQNYYICKVLECKRRKIAKPTSTTNIALHLEKRHNITQCNADVASSNSNVLTIEEKRENCIIKMFVNQNLPFSLMDTDDFREFQAVFGVNLFSATTLKRRISSLFSSSREELINLLDRTCNSIAISLDGWTSPNQEAFIGIIGHWIDNNFNYHERLLDFRHEGRSHSGENMTEFVMTTLEELHLQSKLLSITCDSASNNGSMAKLLNDRLEELVNTGVIASKKFDGEHSFIHCLAHIINLIVRSLLEELKCGFMKEANQYLDFPDDDHIMSAVMKVRSLALYVSGSPKRKQEWLKLVPEDESKKFIQYEVDTRWNSTYHMIQDAIKLQGIIQTYTRQYKLHNFKLTTQDIDNLFELSTILSRFDYLTNLLSTPDGEAGIINSLEVYYQLNDLLMDIKEKNRGMNENNSNLVCNAIEEAMTKYQKYYNIMEDCDAYYISAVLHPRFKAKWLNYHLTANDYQEIISFIKKSITDTYSNTRENTQESAIRVTNERTLMGFMNRSGNRTTNDVESYFSLDVINSGDDYSFKWVLQWWRENQSLYPVMVQAARDYLPIPSTSVSIERQFNNGRDIIGLRRYSLSTESYRELMLLKDYFKYNK